MNALLDPSPIALPSLDAEMQRLCTIHGNSAVRKSAARLAQGKRGRPAADDMPEFTAEFVRDARDWLEGRDPLALRTHYALALEFAKRKPGHNQVATHTRVSKKLSKWRVSNILVQALKISVVELPYSWYFMIIGRIIRLYPDAEQWIETRDSGEADLAKYVERYGITAPDPTFLQIKLGLAAPVVAPLAQVSPLLMLAELSRPSETNVEIASN